MSEENILQCEIEGCDSEVFHILDDENIQCQQCGAVQKDVVVARVENKLEVG